MPSPSGWETCFPLLCPFSHLLRGAGPFSVACDWPFLKSVICEKANFNFVICDRGIFFDV